MAPTSATLENDKQRSIEAAETERLSLHEDSFARYGVRPSDFAAWRDVWEQR
jgi:hypothetical protein